MRSALISAADLRAHTLGIMTQERIATLAGRAVRTGLLLELAKSEVNV